MKKRPKVTSIAHGSKLKQARLERALRAIQLMTQGVRLAAENAAAPDLVAALDRTRAAAEALTEVGAMMTAHGELAGDLERHGMLGYVLLSQKTIEAELERLRPLALPAPRE